MREDVMKNRVLFQLDAETGSPLKITPSKPTLNNLVVEKKLRTAQSLSDNFDAMKDKATERKITQRQWLITAGIVVVALSLFYLALKKKWVKI